MKLEQLFEELKNKDVEDYIVTLKYKYDNEHKYTVENQLLLVDKDFSYIWNNDWNEGQTDIEVLGYCPVSEVKTNIAIIKDFDEMIIRIRALRLSTQVILKIEDSEHDYLKEFDIIEEFVKKQRSDLMEILTDLCNLYNKNYHDKREMKYLSGIDDAITIVQDCLGIDEF